MILQIKQRSPVNVNAMHIAIGQSTDDQRTRFREANGLDERIVKAQKRTLVHIFGILQ